MACLLALLGDAVGLAIGLALFRWRRRCWALRYSASRARGRRSDRQRQREDGAHAHFGMDVDLTAQHAGDDVVHDVQAQARASLAEACGEKRVEHMLHVLPARPLARCPSP